TGTRAKFESGINADRAIGGELVNERIRRAVSEASEGQLNPVLSRSAGDQRRGSRGAADAGCAEPGQGPRTEEEDHIISGQCSVRRKAVGPRKLRDSGKDRRGRDGDGLQGPASPHETDGGGQDSLPRGTEESARAQALPSRGRGGGEAGASEHRRRVRRQ